MANFGVQTRLISPPAELSESVPKYPSSVPNEIILVLTTRCNQKCYFCCEPPNQPDMSFDDAVKWIDIIHDLEIPWVDFSGGEPLLYPNTPDLLKYANSKGLHCTLSTNGILLLQYIEIVWSSVNQWNLSLHGDADTHDQIVGNKGSFDKVINAIGDIISRGGCVHITFVVTPSSLDCIGKVAIQLASIGVAKLCFNYVFRRGKGKETSFYGTQTWMKLLVAVRKIVKHLELYPMIIYHNLNMDGQCILVRSTGEVWAVPMSNSNDYELICKIANSNVLQNSYPYIENHRKFTWPRLKQLHSSILGYDMEPVELWKEGRILK